MDLIFIEKCQSVSDCSKAIDSIGPVLNRMDQEKKNRLKLLQEALLYRGCFFLSVILFDFSLLH